MRASCSTAASSDVLHETRDGWHWGRVLISSGAGREPEFRIEIQNEYLVARHNGRTVTIVPDLIAILDAESAEPLTAETLAYGQRVRVIGYSAAPIMRRPECLKVFGPRLFGLDEDFRPVEELTARLAERSMRDTVAFIFGLGMVFNAALFVPQAIHLWRTKTSQGVSSCPSRASTPLQAIGALHGYFERDYALDGRDVGESGDLWECYGVGDEVYGAEGCFTARLGP